MTDFRVFPGITGHVGGTGGHDPGIPYNSLEFFDFNRHTSVIFYGECDAYREDSYEEGF